MTEFRDRQPDLYRSALETPWWCECETTHPGAPPADLSSRMCAEYEAAALNPPDEREATA
jgi:hypothetical protein